MQKKILLIDDEPSLRISSADELRDKGYIVDEEENGNEALKKIKENFYDLVILDYKLPGKDGLEILKSIKDYKLDVKVILITAYGNINLAVSAMKLGAKDYISKPFELEELAKVVGEVLEKEESVEHFKIENIKYEHKIIGESKVLKKLKIL
jgi:two-component system response regulator HydG/two-component system response regulator AtoC